MKNIYKMRKLSFLNLMLMGLLIAMVAGCKKTFDLEPQDQLDVTNAYQNVYDADAAIVGIYGKFIRLADRYIILNEHF